MRTIIGFVHKNTYELTPTDLRMPPTLWSAFTVINKIHGAWRWYRHFELYRNPENLSQLLAGHLVNFIVGDALVIRIAAQCLLASTRLLECAQAQAKLCRAAHSWMSTLEGNYPKVETVAWEKDLTNSWLSPSTRFWWKSTFLNLKNTIAKIALKTFKLFQHTFRLSMSILDTIDAVSWSPQAQSEGVTESFINITKWVNAMIESKEELIAGLTENKALIERIITYSPITYDQFFNTVVKTIEKTEAIHRHVKNLSKLGGEAIQDYGKKMINGSMVVMGMKELRPGLATKKV